MTFLNRRFLVTVFPACFCYFLFLLFIGLQFNVEFADELLVLFILPTIYSAIQFSKRIYLAVIAYIGFLSYILIYCVVVDFYQSAIILFIALFSFFLTSELLFRFNRSLKETANRFQTTLQSIGDAVISTDRFGRVQYMNPVASKLTGWDPVEAKGKELADVFHIVNSNTRKRCENPVEKVIQTGKTVGLANDTLLISITGEEFQIADAAAPILDQDKTCTGIVLTFRDVTQEYQTQKDIEKNRELLQIFVENAPAPIAMVDTNLCYIAYSKRWLKDYRLQDRDITGVHLYDTFPEIRKKPDWLDIHRRCLTGEVISSDEDSFMRVDGSVDWLRYEVRPWHDTNGEIGGLLLLSEVITEKKKIEEAIEKNEKLYHQAIEVAGAVPYYQNYLTNQYDFIGDGIEQLTGFKPDEFSYEIWESIEIETILLDDLMNLSVSNAVEKAKSSEGISWRADIKIRHKSGEIRWVLNAAIQVRDDAGNVIGSLGILQDITDRKQAEEALKSSELRFRQYFELGLVGMAIVAPEKNWLEFNDTMCGMFGYSREEFSKIKWTDMTHPDDMDRSLYYFNRIISGEIDNYIIEKRYRHKNGETVHVEVSVRSVRNKDSSTDTYLVIVHNITEIKKTEHLLRENEARLLEAQRIAKIGDFKWWIETGEYECSEVMNELFGYSDNDHFDYIELSERFHHPEDKKRVRDWLLKCIQSNSNILTPLEYRLIRKDGEVINVRTQGVIHRENGKAISIFGTVQDITEQKRAEEELVQIDKLRSIGTLAGGIAHDFNNILTGIFGNMSIVREEIDPTHPAYSFIKDAESSLQRASRLTKQLLTFSKGGEPVKEPANIKELIEEVVRFDLSGSNVKPVFYFSDELCLAEIDKGQLQQVFSNLAINADQAMPDGGLLYVSVKRFSNQQRQKSYLDEIDFIQITVQDNGIGIDPAIIDRIFEPYYSTKQTGSGLGLATVFSIINKHNGHIQVDSELGKGSIFTIYLPALNDHIEETVVQIDPIPATEQKKANILVMDDEEVILDLLRSSLTRFGYDVHTEPDGKLAVDAYQAALDDGNPFDIVILDITVPGGMGGEETIRKILSIHPEAKCIVSSGYATDPVMANYKEYGFKAVAPKPYTLDEMKAIIEQVLHE